MRRLRLTYYTVLILATSLMVTAIANAETVTASARNLNAIVDVDHCSIFGSTLCSGSGSVGAAASSNDSIVSVIIHATAPNGTPMTGLPELNFNIFSVTNASGAPLVFVRAAVCAACFAEPEPGVYRFAVRPSAGNWGAGTYIQRIEVTALGGAARQIVIPIDIP